MPLNKPVQKTSYPSSFKAPSSSKYSAYLQIIIIIVLLLSNVFFIVGYYNNYEELQRVENSLEAQQTDKKVLKFANLFIAKVLKAEAEVSFEDRLQLENAVRDLNDEQVLVQWQKFVESQTEKEAQDEVKNLLEMLIKKISY